jgi:hypothetical protein
MSEEEKKEELFGVYAVRKNEQTPLFQTHLSFRRLMDDIIVPFESEELFFIDGAPVKATDLDRIKIIRQHEFFDHTFHDLHHGMRWGGDLKKQELYAKQYHIRLEALLRESGEDVTSQVIKAYRTAIKPKLKDYLPNKETLLDAAIKVFAESIKSLSGA